ncbi:MAG: ribonuclease HII [Rhodothermales bacterium]
MPDAPTLDRERVLWKAGYEGVAGVDEAGRGCLAGPVVAAAVVFRRGDRIDGVTDSKLVSRRDREALAEEIETTAESVGIGMCSPQEVDRLNVLWAAMEAMRRAVTNLAAGPNYLLIDGDRCFPDPAWPYETVVKGDQLCHCIAAASIVAKVTRDNLMRKLHQEYPAYSWASNVGYPTPQHYEALSEYGPTPYHRHSFRLS